MQTVWKYPIPRGQREVAAILPMGARLLQIGMQDDEIVLWALIDSKAPMTTRHLLVLDTGGVINHIDGTDVVHIGSVTDSARVVSHVFERIS